MDNLYMNQTARSVLPIYMGPRSQIWARPWLLILLQGKLIFIETTPKQTIEGLCFGSMVCMQISQKLGKTSYVGK